MYLNEFVSWVATTQNIILHVWTNFPLMYRLRRSCYILRYWASAKREVVYGASERQLHQPSLPCRDFVLPQSQETCLYRLLNAALRNHDARALEPFLPYMKLLLSGLYQLPLLQAKTYRGVKLELFEVC